MGKMETTGFRAIKVVVLDRIRDGTWSPGTFLPSETDLAEEFSTTRTTVNRALRELAEEGVLERKRKAGTRVVTSPRRQARFAIPTARQEVETAGGTYRYARVSLETCTAPDWLRAKLSLADEAPVIHIRAMHYSGVRPFQFEDRWIVEANVPGAADEAFRESGPGEWLVETMPFTDAQLSVSASRAGPELASFLEVNAGDPVFLAERVTWLQDDPVTYVRLFHRESYRMTTQY